MNAKDVFIVIELLVGIILYSCGTSLTIYRTAKAKKNGRRVMNGTMVANIFVMLAWIAVSLGK